MQTLEFNEVNGLAAFVVEGLRFVVPGRFRPLRLRIRHDALPAISASLGVRTRFFRFLFSFFAGREVDCRRFKGSATSLPSNWIQQLDF